MRHFKKVMAVLMLSFVFYGCNKADTEVDRISSLSVMYFDESSFNQKYGVLFAAKFPNIEVKVITPNYRPGNDLQEQLEKVVREQEPDVILTNMDQYTRLSSAGMIDSLEAYMKKNNEMFTGYSSSLIELLRKKGNGQIKGLSSTFSSEALYYNKDLFERNGIPLPTDQMTWDDILRLSNRFPSDRTNGNRIYGFYSVYNSNPFYLVLKIGRDNGMIFVDPIEKKSAFHTESWRKLFELVANQMHEGSLYTTKEKNGDVNSPKLEDRQQEQFPFLSGNIAMALENTAFYQVLQDGHSEIGSKMKWDLVTAPVNPSNGNENNAISLNEIFSINTRSKNKEAAWAFISYISSVEYMKPASKIPSGNLLARTNLIPNAENRNIEAFYKLSPMKSTSYPELEKFSNEFLHAVDKEGVEAMNSILNGSKTTDEALRELDEKLQIVQ